MPPKNPPSAKKAVQATENPTVAAMRRLAANAAQFGGGAAKNFAQRASDTAGLVKEAFYTNFYPDSLAKLGLIPQNTRPTPRSDEVRAGLVALGQGLATSPVQTVKNIVTSETERLAAATRSPGALGEYAASWVSPGSLASKAPGPVRKIYIGKNAKGWNAAAEQQAWNMEALNKTPDEIYAATGTFRGPDGEWRQEIDDSTARLTINKTLAERRDTIIKDRMAIGEAVSLGFMLSKHRNRQSSDGGMSEAIAEYKAKYGHEPSALAVKYAQNHDVPQLMNMKESMEQQELPTHEKFFTAVGDIFDHPELWQQYPEMRHAKFEIKPASEMDGARGWYDPRINLVVISSDIARDAKQAKSVLLHELGHTIQSKEKWARGGDPRQFPQLALQHPKALHLSRDWSDALFGRTNAPPHEVLNALKNNSADSSVKDELKRVAVKKYGFKSVDEAIQFLEYEVGRTTPYGQHKHLAGEAESRSIQSRMNMSPAERAASIPTGSYDVPIKNLTIVR